MIKTYVLDTNILLQTEGRVINGFDDNVVVIPGMVLEELDNQKTAPGERGFAARECIRRITEIKDNNHGLAYGVSLDNGGIFEIESNSDMSYLPSGWKADKPDNIILGTVIYLTKAEREKNNDNKVVLITNDVSMQVKASIIGVEVQSYKNDQVVSDKSYTGKDVLYLPDSVLQELYARESVPAKSVIIEENKKYNADFAGLLENCFYITKNFECSSSALSYFYQGNLHLIKASEFDNIAGISPKNSDQIFAMEALMRPVDEIPLVILKGCAGSGKTMLTLAAALYQMEKCMYDKIIITRSNTLADEELGFLPGTLEEKMGPLLAPFYDNLRFLLRMTGEDDEQINLLLDDMIERGTIEIVSLAYIRGRSIPNTFIIIDEAQNLSINQCRTIATRIGIGSKLCLMGDTSQIDNPKLDKRNNGLSFISEKFAGNGLCQQVEFTESVRSAISAEAIRLLG